MVIQMVMLLVAGVVVLMHLVQKLKVVLEVEVTEVILLVQLLLQLKHQEVKMVLQILVEVVVLLLVDLAVHTQTTEVV